MSKFKSFAKLMKKKPSVKNSMITVPSKEQGITMTLGRTKMKLNPKTKRWSAAGGGDRGNKKELETLRERCLFLEEENNMLKYKMEVLLHMLTTTSLDLYTFQEFMEHSQSSGGEDGN